jgi:hypothetical protein
MWLIEHNIDFKTTPFVLDTYWKQPLKKCKILLLVLTSWELQTDRTVVAANWYFLLRLD